MSGEGGSGVRLSDAQIVDWLRLIRSENVGPRTFRQLINRYGGAAAALDALPELGARAKGRAIRIFDRDEALREFEKTRALGGRFVALGDGDYPQLLREIDDAPPLIVVRGAVETLARAAVAIVGSRNASAAGLAITERLARDLARADFVIVSGLARGIDTVAHRAALATGTVAVLAGGHARPYPSENLALLESIVEGGGAVVSEMPLEWEPRGRDFPRRNRIVSGLAQGTVVVEAARRSGSLITARFAAEQNRDVFAVPGSPLDPRAEGTNDLIRQGAHLCAGAEDVLRALSETAATPRFREDLFGEAEALPEQEEPLFDELDLFSFEEGGKPFAREVRRRSVEKPPVEPGMAPQAPTPPSADASPVDARERVLALLGPSPVSVDELVRAAGLPAREVQGVLLELDLAGRLARHGPNSVSLLQNQS